MEKPNKNIQILTGDFFPTWAFALTYVLIVGAIVSIIYQLIYHHHTTFALQVAGGLFLIVCIILSSVVWFSKKFFEFNPGTKQCRKGYYLFGLKRGEWTPLEIGRAYIAFQRYNEDVHYSYGFFFKQSITDSVFELRLVYPDLTFKTLVNGRDFQSVAMMLQLGKILSLIYNVEFKDFVKGVIRKESMKKQ